MKISRMTFNRMKTSRMKIPALLATAMAVVLLIAPLALAATISGEIYEFDLTPAQGVVVNINTEPRQQVVAVNGSYSLEVPQGSYVLVARQGSKAETTENITVAADGSYALDLILFPLVDEEIDGEIEQAIAATEENAGWQATWLWLISLLFAGAAIWFLLKRAKSQKALPEKSAVTALKPEPKPELDQLLAIIRQEGGRTTQKELRKKMPYSEAKVSLMLTELQHEGRIERIKKGRSNVIVLKHS